MIALAKYIRRPERHSIAPLRLQVRRWRKASRKMKWAISRDEFRRIVMPPSLPADDRKKRLEGFLLCYGFGDDGNGYADAVLSGQMAWDYARRKGRKKIWQCEYIRFDSRAHLRLRPEAPPRPRGFYWAAIQSGIHHMHETASWMRRRLGEETGAGPEVLQWVCITQPRLADEMNRGKRPGMALIDYDMAPYGFYDFFDILQVFCSVDTLGLGMGHVDRNYPHFGIPILRIFT